MKNLFINNYTNNNYTEVNNMTYDKYAVGYILSINDYLNDTFSYY